MPIGKNSIKRVANNGYSKVASTAPDMENSTVAVEKNATVKTTAQTKKAPAKCGAKKTESPVERAKKKVEENKKAQAKVAHKKAEPKPAPEKAAPTATQVSEETATLSTREGEGYVNLGGSLPIYLL